MLVSIEKMAIEIVEKKAGHCSVYPAHALIV